MNFKRQSLDTYTDLNWAASATKSLKLPRDRFIQQIILRLKVTGNTDSSVTAANDGILAAIGALRITRGGNPIFNLTGADLWRINQYQFGRVGLASLITTTSQTGATLGEAEFIIPFMLNPKNPNDVKAVLPAHMFSSLDLYVDWGAAASPGTGYTITSAELRVALKEVDLTKEELGALKRIFMVNYSYEEKTHDAAYTDYKFQKDLPVGKILQEVFMTTIDNSVRNTGIMSAFKVKGIDNEFVKWDFTPSQNADAAEFGFPSGNIVTGFTAAKLSKMGAIDARGFSAGQLKVLANIGSPSSTSKTRFAYIELS